MREEGRKKKSEGDRREERGEKGGREGGSKESEGRKGGRGREPPTHVVIVSTACEGVHQLYDVLS